MNIAYTINGLIGGLNGKNSERKTQECRTKIASYCKNTINDFFCKEDNIDFFIFTWENDILNEIKEIYKAKVCISEKQPRFNIPIGAEDTPRTQNHIARWYGYKRIIEELTKWSSENNISYDYVINARFDLCWNRPYSIKDKNKILLSRYSGWFKKSDQGKFSEDERFNIDLWPPENQKGFSKIDLADHVFGYNIDFMKNLGHIYEKINYLHYVKKYGRDKVMSHHRLLPGMIKDLGFKQNDISYIHHYDNGGSHMDDYDIIRYRNLGKI